MRFNRTNRIFLFWLAVAGLVLYAVGPIFLADVDNLRQPELLPVYAAMLGIGQLLKDDNEESGDNEEEDQSE